MTTKKISLKNLILLLIFATLCVFATWFQIPLGYDSSLNLSYIIVVLVALLCGGWMAGLSGIIGMCLLYLLKDQPNDALLALTFSACVGVGTIIIKWLIAKFNLDKTIFLYGTSAFLIGLGIVFSCAMIRCGETYVIPDLEITMKIYWPIIVFPYVLGGLYLIAAILFKKLPESVSKVASISCFFSLVVLIIVPLVAFLMQLGNHGFVGSLATAYNKYTFELGYAYIISVLVASGLYCLFAYQRYLNKRVK